MKILIVTQYYYPELFKSTDIGEEFVKRGHQVDALVGIPNYPEGKYFQGYGLFKKRYEIVNGVNIYRCFQIPRGKKASVIGLSLNYLSFVLSATLWVLFFFSWKKYDVIIAQGTSPITQIIPAIILGKIRKIPVYSWILDIWPDSAMGAIPKNKAETVRIILSVITEFVYRHSSLILVSSKGMMELVNRNHDYSKKLVYFPNWCDDILLLPKKNSITLPAGFIVMMAGNLNTGIGVDAIIDLVESLSDITNLRFVFVGGGTKEEYMRKVFEKKGLRNVIMTGRLPFSQIPALYEQADVMLLTLKKTPYRHLKATVPARLQSYMAAGKPVIAMIDGCSQDIINHANCGYAVPAGDVQSLSNYIHDVVMTNPGEFLKKGIQSRLFFEMYYRKEQCISNLEYYIKEKEIDNPPYPVPKV